MSSFSFNMFSEESTSQLRRRNLRRGETLFVEGATVESVFFVEQGCVRLEVEPEPGKQMVLYRARTKEAFAEEHLVLEDYSYRGVADEDTIVQSIPKTNVLSDIRDDPTIARAFIACLGRRYYQLRVNFERLGIRSAKDRVLHLLRTMRTRQYPIDITGKIKSFSDDLNLTHEATYRALRELEREGAIVRDDGLIFFKDEVV